MSVFNFLTINKMLLTSAAMLGVFVISQPVLAQNSGQIRKLEPQGQERITQADLEFLTGEGAPDSDALAPSGQSEDENLFFDANDLVPRGELGSTGPRKLNPALEPASKFIVVEKNASGNSQPAQIVAAQRALLLGRYDAALEMFDRLYERRKQDSNVLMGRAVSLQNLGRNDEAVMAYQELLDANDGNLDAEINMLGLMSAQYPAVSLQRLLDLRERHPDSVAVVAQTAVAYAQMQRYDDALQYLGIAASMEPNNANHLFNIAVVADRGGNKKEAINYYEKALEMDTVYGGGKSIPRDNVYERLSHLR